MRHVCDYCGKRLSAIRRFRGERFCAPQHEQLYEARQAELAVERMREEFALDDQVVITQPLPAAKQTPLPESSVADGLRSLQNVQNETELDPGFDPSPLRRGLDAARPPAVGEPPAASHEDYAAPLHPSESYPSERFVEQRAKLTAPLVSTSLAPYAISVERPPARNHPVAVQGQRDWQDFGSIQKPKFSPRLPNLHDLLEPSVAVPETNEIVSEPEANEEQPQIPVASAVPLPLNDLRDDLQGLPLAAGGKRAFASPTVTANHPSSEPVTAHPASPQPPHVVAAGLPLAGLLHSDAVQAVELRARSAIRGSANLSPSLSPGRIVLPKMKVSALPDSVLGPDRLPHPNELLEWSKPFAATPPAAFVQQPAAELAFPLGAQVPDWQYPKFQEDPLFTAPAPTEEPAFARPVALAGVLTSASISPLQSVISGGIPDIQAVLAPIVPTFALIQESALAAPAGLAGVLAAATIMPLQAAIADGLPDIQAAFPPEVPARALIQSPAFTAPVLLAGLLASATISPLQAAIPGTIPDIHVALAPIEPIPALSATSVLAKPLDAAQERGVSAFATFTPAKTLLHRVPRAPISLAGPSALTGPRGEAQSAEAAFVELFPQPVLETRLSSTNLVSTNLASPGSASTIDLLAGSFAPVRLSLRVLQPGEIQTPGWTSRTLALTPDASQLSTMGGQAAPILPETASPLVNWLADSKPHAQPALARPQFAPVSFGRRSPSPWYSQANAEGPSVAGPTPAATPIDLARLAPLHSPFAAEFTASESIPPGSSALVNVLPPCGPVSLGVLSPASWFEKTDTHRAPSPAAETVTGVVLPSSLSVAPATRGFAPGFRALTNSPAVPSAFLSGPVFLGQLAPSSGSRAPVPQALLSALPSMPGSLSSGVKLPDSLGNTGNGSNSASSRARRTASVVQSPVRFGLLRALDPSLDKLPVADGAITAFSLRRHLSLRLFEQARGRRSGITRERLAPTLAGARQHPASKPLNPLARKADQYYAMELGTQLPAMEAPAMRSAVHVLPASPMHLCAGNYAFAKHLVPPAQHNPEIQLDLMNLAAAGNRIEAAARLAPQSAPQQELSGYRNLARTGLVVGPLLRPEPLSTGGSSLVSDAVSTQATSLVDGSKPLSSHVLQSTPALNSQGRLPFQVTHRSLDDADTQAGSLPSPQAPATPEDIGNNADFEPAHTLPDPKYMLRVPGQSTATSLRGFARTEVRHAVLQHAFVAPEASYVAGRSAHWMEAAAVFPGEAGQALDHPARIPLVEARPGVRPRTATGQQSVSEPYGREAAAVMRRPIPAFSGRFSPAALLVLPGKPLSVTRSSVPEHFSDPQRNIAPLFKLQFGKPEALAMPPDSSGFARLPAAIQPKAIARMHYPAIPRPYLDPRLPATALHPVLLSDIPQPTPESRTPEVAVDGSDPARKVTSIGDVLAQPSEYPQPAKSDSLLATERRWQSWKSNLARRRPIAAAPVSLAPRGPETDSLESLPQRSGGEPAANSLVPMNSVPSSEPAAAKNSELPSEPASEIGQPLLRRPPRPAGIIMPSDRFRARLLREAGGRTGIDPFRHVPEAMLQPASKTGTGGPSA